VNTLILLHGLASNSTRWWYFVANTRLREGWRVLRPDLRGHAGSIDRGRIGMREWCGDLAALLDAEGCPRAVIGGHCLGAHIALQFAARYPERTAALVLIEPMPREALVGTLKWVPVLRPLLIALALIARLANALGIHRRKLEPMNLEQWDRATSSGEAAIARYASPLSDLRTTPLAAYLQGLAAFGDRLPALSKIRSPALVLLSTGSTLADPARTRAAMEKLPEVEIVVIDAGHWIPAEQPEAMRAAIDGWLSRADRDELPGARGL
jgi:pimeloyl-ACP methyl ester carboxylesterase